MNGLRTAYEIPASEIDSRELVELEQLLVDEHGLVRSVSAAQLDAFKPSTLKVWGPRASVHGYTTHELVEFLRELIGDTHAIEICAGVAGLGRQLGIPSTDSYARAENGLHLAMLQRFGLPPMRLPPYVERLEAYQAVLKYRPETVIASWPVQHSPVERASVVQDGNRFGVREDKILERVRTYVLIGNLDVHHVHRIFDLPHETFRLPGICSSARNPDANALMIWRR